MTGDAGAEGISKWKSIAATSTNLSRGVECASSLPGFHVSINNPFNDVF